MNGCTASMKETMESNEHLITEVGIVHDGCTCI